MCLFKFVYFEKIIITGILITNYNILKTNIVFKKVLIEREL